MAGVLGVCESLGITSFSTPIVQRSPNSNTALPSDELSSNEQGPSLTKGSGANGKGSKSQAGAAGTGGGGGGGRRSGSGKKYSLRCANLVQKKIQDYIQTDDVMEEL